jgi:epoxyqueuosine reductase QueG
MMYLLARTFSRKIAIPCTLSLAFMATTYDIDSQTLSTGLPHKTTATLAGLGWIGKCALLVTERYGSAIRLTAVLTEAELPCGEPVSRSRCGACADKCHFYIGSGDPKNMPVLRAELLRFPFTVGTSPAPEGS